MYLPLAAPSWNPLAPCRQRCVRRHRSALACPHLCLHCRNLMRVQHSGGGRALHRSPSPLLALGRVGCLGHDCKQHSASCRAPLGRLWADVRSDSLGLRVRSDIRGTVVLLALTWFYTLNCREESMGCVFALCMEGTSEFSSEH